MTGAALVYAPLRSSTARKNVPVKLHWFESLWACMVGLGRYMLAVVLNRQPTYGSNNGDALPLHILGAAGELAFAKAAGLYWDGNPHTPDTRGAPDVAPNFEVRTRQDRKDNDQTKLELIVHPRDPADRVYVLVVSSTLQEFRVVGWMIGRIAQHEKYWKDPAGGRAAFFVAQGDLYPFPLPSLPS